MNTHACIRTHAAAVLGAVLLTLACSTAGAQKLSADSLTLDDAIRMALTANPAVARAEHGMRSAEARTRQVHAGRMPVIDAVAQYNRIGPAPELSFPGLGSFKLFPEDNPDVHVEASYTLYDFGRTSAAEEAVSSRVREAALGMDAARATIAFQTIQTFHTVTYLRQSLRVEDEEIATLGQHLDLNTRKVEAGTATDFDVLSTKVRIASAEARRIDLTAELSRQEITLRRLLALPADAPLRLQDDLTAASAAPAADSLVALALRQRSELASSRAQEQSAALDLRAASYGSMPTLNLHGSYGLKNGYIPNLDAMRGNWVVGAALRVPIYEGDRTTYKEQEAAAQLEANRARSEDLARDISAEVRRAITDMEAAQAKIASAEVVVQHAREALAIARKRYLAGSGSNIDVLDAETALAQAGLLDLRARYGLVASRAALEHATGVHVWNGEHL